jgi:hypothetical protein
MAPTVADRRAPGSSGPLALYGLPGPQLHEDLRLLAVDLEQGAEILAAHQPWPRVRTPAAIAPEVLQRPGVPGRRSTTAAGTPGTRGDPDCSGVRLGHTWGMDWRITAVNNGALRAAEIPG